MLVIAGKILSGENSKGLIFSGASRWRALSRAVNGAYSLRIFPTLRKSLRAQFKNPSSGQISNSDTWWIFTNCLTLSTLCMLLSTLCMLRHTACAESRWLNPTLCALHKEYSKSDEVTQMSDEVTQKFKGADAHALACVQKKREICTL